MRAEVGGLRPGRGHHTRREKGPCAQGELVCGGPEELRRWHAPQPHRDYLRLATSAQDCPLPSVSPSL